MLFIRIGESLKKHIKIRIVKKVDNKMRQVIINMVYKVERIFKQKMTLAPGIIIRGFV